MPERKLTHAAVDRVFRSCFFDEGALDGLDDEQKHERAVMVEGIMHTIGFDPAKLQRARPEVEDLLDELDPRFADGWTFLNLCVDRHGEHWTDLHQTMEQLMLLGIAIGRVSYYTPRKYWPTLYGEMPYITVTPRGEPPKIKL